MSVLVVSGQNREFWRRALRHSWRC
jgi:hypothetical protein